jgi:hypothetical protein
MKLSITFLLILTAVVASCPAMADRIIFAPTGTTLAGGEVRVEGAISPSLGDSKAYWIGMGLQRIELTGMRVKGNKDVLGAQDADIIGAEMSVLPETTLTPGVGVGVWDATAETTKGRGYYLAITKILPVVSEFPSPLRDIRVHAGIGTGGIDGFFGGAEATIPLGLKLSAEYFNKDFNFAVGKRLLPGVQAKVYLLDGEMFYGLQLSPPL